MEYLRTAEPCFGHGMQMEIICISNKSNVYSKIYWTRGHCPDQPIKEFKVNKTLSDREIDRLLNILDIYCKHQYSIDQDSDQKNGFFTTCVGHELERSRHDDICGLITNLS